MRRTFGLEKFAAAATVLAVVLVAAVPACARTMVDDSESEGSFGG